MLCQEQIGGEEAADMGASRDGDEVWCEGAAVLENQRFALLSVLRTMISSRNLEGGD